MILVLFLHSYFVLAFLHLSLNQNVYVHLRLLGLLKILNNRLHHIGLLVLIELDGGEDQERCAEN